MPSSNSASLFAIFLWHLLMCFLKFFFILTLYSHSSHSNYFSIGIKDQPKNEDENKDLLPKMIVAYSQRIFLKGSNSGKNHCPKSFLSCDAVSYGHKHVVKVENCNKTRISNFTYRKVHWTTLNNKCENFYDSLVS